MRPTYHFSVPDHWKNDPQRPLWIGDRWHYWYLYNADHGREDGTAWRLATSPDLVRWHDQGVAIPKMTNANLDVWSGSAVVDVDDTAGFGPGSVVALLTQTDHPTARQRSDGSGPQAQFLWNSVDGGRTFTPHTDQPVLPNGGRKDFRDPKVVRDDERGRWVCLVAQGDRTALFTSADLKSWQFASEFLQPDLGVIECPDLFRITAQDGTSTWILACSANGHASGEPNTFCYWTGSFDGERFTADGGHQWLDHGFDFYGAVTFEHREDPEHVRYALAWMNNWAYARQLPTWEAEGFIGSDSIVRELRCVRREGRLRLVSRPLPELDGISRVRHELGEKTVDGSLRLDLRAPSCRVEADITWQEATNVGLRLFVSPDGGRHVDAGICGTYSYLNRGSSGQPDPTRERVESRAPFPASARTAHLVLLVDRCSVEMFVDDGEVVHSHLVFPTPGDDRLELFTVGGPASFTNLSVTEFDEVVQRPARLLADFEAAQLPGGWQASGSLDHKASRSSTLAGQVGNRVLDTGAAGDGATGSLESPDFTIDRDHLHLLLAGVGSCHLLVGGQRVRSATAVDDLRMHPVDWDVREFAGRQGRVQVIDEGTGGRGAVMVDQILLSD